MSLQNFGGSHGRTLSRHALRIMFLPAHLATSRLCKGRFVANTLPLILLISNAPAESSDRAQRPELRIIQGAKVSDADCPNSSI